MNDITAVIAEMRARRVNHGKFDSPTLQTWANRIEVAAAEANLCRHMWERTMDMAAPAMDYVQRNADKFGALPGDDRLEIVCREFLRAQVGGDRFWPELDRLLTDAYNAGTEGADLDLIAARKAIAARQPGAQVPVAWQMRTDERHNGFDDDQWMEIPRDEYEARKRVMDGHGPKRLAGAAERGHLRIDDGGWMIELRQLFDAPPAQGIDLAGWEFFERDGAIMVKKAGVTSTICHADEEDANGPEGVLLYLLAKHLIDQRDAAPGV